MSEFSPEIKEESNNPKGFVDLELAQQVQALCLVALSKVPNNKIIQWIESSRGKELTEAEKLEVEGYYGEIAERIPWGEDNSMVIREQLGVDPVKVNDVIVDAYTKLIK